ncbi:SDR family oxidoreductase [Celerinatantimonas yamalensis]|uniref:SDR family oxidoreductase n=1 Tax=Celerinatantimonas yamalensis TaxID=559956 RepID=A0ABW9G9A3_9GAMM
MKHAFITGIGHRLGFYLALRLIDQGYTVSGQYRSERDTLAKLSSQGVTLYQADFTKWDSLCQLAEQLSPLPRLDLLVHNASAFYPTQDDPQAQAQDMAKFAAVHMQAPLLLTETLSDALKAGEDSCIVALTDIYIHHPNPRLHAYCASKAGLDNLMQSYALRLAPEVRVNCIEPGPILFLDEHDSAYRQQILDRTPLQCEGGLEPIWQALAMIIQNRYLTGARIAVDGGRSVAQL